MKTITTCSKTADYSKVAGERILPFLFALNETDSILYPEEGQQQKFCYDVTGIGMEGPQYADLSRFSLGICKDITKEDIADVTVVVDGVKKEVIWGTNVEIKTEEKSDSTSECVGINFDFPLNRITGEMQVCITMKNPYAIGPVTICVRGGREMADNLTICGPVCGSTPSCESTFYQKETVCVPVTVTPFATSKNATARCCGEPVVAKQNGCPKGEKACTFTVTQPLCIEISIEFGADIDTGTASVICGDVSKTGCDCNGVEDATVTDEYNMARRTRFLNR